MTTLIKNVQLIDGTGRAPIKADVLIKRRKIAAIGDFPRYRANRIIDARGAYLAPGFIDLHSSIDRYLSIFPNLDSNNLLDLLRQGVTTVIGGQDGMSLAPIIYGSLDLHRDWVNIKKININWHSVREFLKTLKKLPLILNFGTFVGYQTIRHSLIGKELRQFTSNEIKIFKSLLKKSFREGVFGFSIGPEDLKQEVPYSEIRGILDIIAKHKGLYATELYGKGEEKMSCLYRIINLTEGSGLKTLINHLEPIRSHESDYDKILELVDASSTRANICFDFYPRDLTVFPIYFLLPDWLIDKNKREIPAVIEKLKEPKIQKRVIKELPQMKGSDVSIISAPEYSYLNGKTLRDFSRNREITIFMGILKLMELTRGRAIISMKNVNLKKLMRSLSHSQSIIASADMHLKEAPQGTFPKFLDLIEKDKIMPIETAVSKMTGLPAECLGLKNRGLVKTGYAADIVIFRDGEVRQIFLNGDWVIKDGKFQNLNAGEVLIHKN